MNVSGVDVCLSIAFCEEKTDGGAVGVQQPVRAETGNTQPNVDIFVTMQKKCTRGTRLSHIAVTAEVRGLASVTELSPPPPCCGVAALQFW